MFQKMGIITGTATITPTPSRTPTASRTSTPTRTPTATTTGTALPPSVPVNSAFTYDGDGRRVKSTTATNLGQVTTFFVGSYYEVSGSTIIKYYYAGSQRIAMKKNGLLSFTLHRSARDSCPRRILTEGLLKVYNPLYGKIQGRKRCGSILCTFTVVEWLPVFIDETACKLITESLNYCILKKHLRVNAYVIMPTHLHAILFDVDFDSDRLKHTLDDMRKFTGRQLLDYSTAHLPKSFMEVFKQSAGKDRERRFWQSTQHPVGIFSNGFWKQKFDYLHNNPRRKGLVLRAEDWRFSSALYWSTREQNDVQLSDVGWE